MTPNILRSSQTSGFSSEARVESRQVQGMLQFHFYACNLASEIQKICGRQTILELSQNLFHSCGMQFSLSGELLRLQQECLATTAEQGLQNIWLPDQWQAVKIDLFSYIQGRIHLIYLQGWDLSQYLHIYGREVPTEQFSPDSPHRRVSQWH